MPGSMLGCFHWCVVPAPGPWCQQNEEHRSRLRIDNAPLVAIPSEIQLFREQTATRQPVHEVRNVAFENRLLTIKRYYNGPGGLIMKRLITSASQL